MNTTRLLELLLAEIEHGTSSRDAVFIVAMSLRLIKLPTECVVNQLHELLSWHVSKGTPNVRHITQDTHSSSPAPALVETVFVPSSFPPAFHPTLL
ncbi:MAG: hypothetical protein COV91_04000 [Candidatus Taylorbacteria bacterium CG11_big_fil_rev_8_21_14_0_20_46_11]|uniref:Uncharacterized protein n=1 Tax=Candidatus Taylorbacteria bacterium CG11_big_fil_rev_8_21_14_0_20_46_11 TaxID=1975025 RepID=A0A2H0KDJ2_9BACT|nr:MAG: hypothetical protein COV91_04000 [Candidatus Taylorbacteria bacterium CG11_big_fil_rev_8_21_14_0_20_46_11]